MENIANKVEEIVMQFESEQKSFEDMLKFDDILKRLGKLVILETPTYDLPMVDTIGKNTYNSINNK